MKMINDLNHLDKMSYYRLYQEVQSAKQAARMNIRKEVVSHEQKRDHVRVNNDNNVMAPRKWGSNLDIIA